MGLVKLNLGAGDRYVEGWHNVDSGSPHRKDQELDLRGPLPWSGVQFAYAGHVLEHLYVDDVLSLLRRLLSCMASDGELMVVGPDVILAEAMAQAGTLDVAMSDLTNGGHRWPGDEHRWHCTSAGLDQLLRCAGWSNVTPLSINEVPQFWPVADRGPQWQCAVSARP